MSSIDKDVIESRLSIILENVNELSRFKEMVETTFLSESRNTASAHRFFQRAIEAMIDIGNHIIARKQLGIPESNLHTFQLLEKAGIISKEHLLTYQKMVRFRNLLVYLYHVVENKRVFEIIHDELDDFKMFIADITDFLNKDKP